MRSLRGGFWRQGAFSILPAMFTKKKTATKKHLWNFPHGVLGLVGSDHDKNIMSNKIGKGGNVSIHSKAYYPSKGTLAGTLLVTAAGAVIPCPKRHVCILLLHFRLPYQ